MRQASTSFSSKNVEIFWGKYIENLRKQRVKDSAQRWYVMRAEDFIRAARGRKLLDHSAEDVNHYLEEQGRKAGLQGWQFLQVIDAIQILLETANAPASSQVNWDYWRNSAQELADSHPTIARTGGILPTTESTGRMPLLDAVRLRYGSSLDELVVVIRQRNYSIRTEQAYLSWVCRFLLFAGKRRGKRGQV